ncbi:ATP-binding protein [Leptolyngbya sp. AN02str]|uniref:ATP-binding protein n=1 Tax=Leptolyngbya sp. AN02str TaxID=3423363 RepID=UPI003D31FD57
MVSSDRGLTSDVRQIKLPRRLIWAVIIICILPLSLNLIGLNFGIAESSIDFSTVASLPSDHVTNLLHRTLAGSFVHTILEWSAFCSAIFTVILAFAYFGIQRDATTPIIGMTLLCAGVMDAFHTLAADRLIGASGNDPNLVPFTWALCRMGNALLTMVGVGFFIWLKPRTWTRSTSFVVAASISLGAIAYATIQICATRQSLPTTLFPNSLITRPWDVIPLVLFLVSGLWIYPKFYQHNPSIFSHALVVSTIPNVATQLHMAFGSTALFDNHFNVAHFLKIVAYFVPLAGLILNYVNVHREVSCNNQNLQREIVERKQAEQVLLESEHKEREKSHQLERALCELQQAQAQLVQGEKMSSLGQLVAGIAHEINNPVNFIHGNIHHANQYIQDLLSLLNLYQASPNSVDPDIQQKIDDIDLEFIQQDLPKLLNSIQIGSDRIRDIVHALRVFSRLDEAEVKAVDLHQGIDSTLMILHSRLKTQPHRPEIAVVKEYATLPLVQCYAGQLNQVFMNILSNAIDALEEVWTTPLRQLIPTEAISVSASCPIAPGTSKLAAERQAPVPGPQITIRTSIDESGWVTVAIADNGPGIPEGIQKEIFNPFFTTKPIGKGTGLGMSISYQIVTEKHGGTLECTSQPPVGTTFLIRIPTTQSALA